MIHPSAIVDSRCQIDPTVEIGPYAVIEGPVRIAAGCRIESHAQIVGDVSIGEGTVIGRAAIIGANPQDLTFDPGTTSGVIIGPRNTIREHVTIHRSSKEGGVTVMGEGNFLMVGCHLGHDVRVGDNNVIANAALLAGHVRLGSNSFIGGGAVFHQFLRIGDCCMAQGNGSFGKDIPHFCRAQRTNRLAGLNVVGLRRAGFAAADRAAVKEVFDLVFRSGRNLSQAIAAARGRSWPPPAEKFLEFIEEPSRQGVCTPGNERDDAE